MDNTLRKLNRKANYLFSVWRSLYWQYQYDGGNIEKVNQAEIEYRRAEEERQRARKDAGLPYLLSIDKTPEEEKCGMCGKTFAYLEGRLIINDVVYCYECNARDKNETSPI